MTKRDAEYIFTLEARTDAASEPSEPMQMFVLIFTDAGQSLGEVILEAHSPVNAVYRTAQLGCNPGGSVAVLDVDDVYLQNVSVQYRDRLLDKATSARVVREAMGRVN